MVSAPRCRPGARGLLALLMLLPLPGARGLCGTLPRLRRAIPHDTNHAEGFPINAEVTYKCVDGCVKIPGKSDTVVCLPNSEWSSIGEFCDHDCGAPPRLKSAALSKEDERKNYHPRGSTVRYVCRPGYERTELTPVITCLENLTWSESPEFCRGKSCGVPKGPEHGRAVDVTNDLYGAKVNINCDDGFRLRGRTFIQCLRKGDQVEWSPLPTCQAITCSPPPDIVNGTHNGSNMEIFHRNSSVTYKCDHNFSLTGEASIHCTTKDNINGVWNGSAPECKVIITQDKPTTVPPEGAEGAGTSSGLCGTLPRLRRAIPRDANHTGGFPINAEVTYKCVDGCVKIPGKSDSVVCLPNSEWSSIGEFCDHDCGAPPRLKSAALSKEDERKNYHPRGSTVRYVCRPGYERTELTPVITCLENLTWSESPEFCRGKSCGVPKGPEHGRAVDVTNDLYGAKVNIICDDGDWETRRMPFPVAELSAYFSGDVIPTSCYQISNHFAKEGSIVYLILQMGKLKRRGEVTSQGHPQDRGRNENGIQVSRVPVRWFFLNLPRDFFHLLEMFRLRGRTFIQCLRKGDQVEWSPLPTCQAITCSPPPDIVNGTHNGSNMEIFHRNSSVTYKCDHNFSLTGEASIHCTTKDNINGVWNGSAPECKGLCGTLPRLRRAIPRDANHTGGFPINAEVTYKCVDGCVKIPGKSDSVVCLPNSEWSSIGEFCDHDCGAPPRLKSAALSKEDERKNYHPRGSTVRYVCRPGYERTELTPVITCLENSAWSESPEFCRGSGTDKLGIGLGIGGAVVIICAGIVGASILWQKKKRSYGVNLDSRKHHIMTELILKGRRLRPATSPSAAAMVSGPRCPPAARGLLALLMLLLPRLPGARGTCDSPPRLHFAELPGGGKNSYPVGTRLQYSCRPGYILSSGKSPFVTCLENSKWSVDPEFCVGRPCKPLELENGRVDLTDLRFGATANFSCNEGYRLIGPTSAQCVLVGNGVDWDTEVQLCQALPCLPPPDITDGSHSGQSGEEFSFGSAVTYRCDPGFSLIGEASIHCTTKDQVNGEWSGPAPECKVVKCPEPEVKNGKKQSGFGPDYSYGNAVIFACDSGYTLHGSSSVRCEANNSWVPSLPTCLVVKCPEPEVKNGKKQSGFGPNYSYGNTVIFECDSGYTLHGSSSVRCEANNSWVPSLPTCLGRPCKPLELQNGRVDLTDFRFGATANFSCSEGLIGPTSAPCALVGECTIQCSIVVSPRRLRPATLPAAAMVSGPRCPPGLWGLLALLLLSRLPGARGTCDSPPRLHFAELPGVMNNSYPVGTRLKYSCRPGYILSSGKSPFVTCLENSKWSVDPEFCEGRPCQPLELENGRVDLTDLRFGATANFSCNEGYRLIGATSAQCVLVGNGVDWDKEVPLCQAIPCLPPPDITHGSHNGQSGEEFSFGSAVTYKCDPGFSLIGEASIHCTTKDQVNGEWSGPAPECKVVKCPEPEVKNGKKQSGFGPDYSYGNAVIFACDSGYTLHGSSSVRCEANNSWVPSLPTCLGTCDSPPRLHFAELPGVVNNSYPVGTRLQYSCRPGYILSSGKSPFVTCLENSKWSVDPEFCEGRPCQPLELENGRVDLTDLRFGATANFSCNEGYRLIGATSAQCVLVGNGVDWDKEVPLCQEPTLNTTPNGPKESPGPNTGTMIAIGILELPSSSIVVSPRRLRPATLPAAAMVSGPRCPPGLWGLLALLLLSRLPGARGTCDSPPRLHFAELSGVVSNSYPVGTRLKYSCRPGYILSSGKSPLVTCLENSKWSVDPEFCVGRPCKALELENGRVDLTDLRFGATANFSCNEGYRLIGATSAQCVLVGNGVDWDKEVPLCQAIPCLPPPDITDGSHNGQSGEDFSFGSAVTYKCDPGFSLIGEASIHCTTKDQVNGEWSGPAPECKVVKCPEPEVKNGKKQSGFGPDYSYGNTVIFECDSGYTLHGSSSVRCEANNSWVPSLPTCLEPTLNTTPNGPKESPGPNTGTVIAIGGNALRPLRRRRLRPATSPSAAAMVSEPRCPPAARGLLALLMLLLPRLPGARGTCDSPPRLHFAELSGVVNNSYPVGTRLKYSCRPGYILSSGKSPFVTCLENSKWSVGTEFCEGRRCKPLELENGKGDLMDLRFGARANFSCDEGYRLIGATSAQCVIVEKGVDWDTEVPLCQAIPCLPPPDITDGSHNGQSGEDFSFGSAVTYKCDPGFSLIGEASIHCTTKDQVNGEWSGPAPECKVVKCPEPEVKNGKKQSGFGPDYSYGNAVIFACDSGYTLHGSSSVRCEANNSWVPSLPTCLGTCDSPPRLHFAELPGGVKNSYPVGTKLQYSCRPGYILSSGKSPFVTCLENSKWSVDPEFCEGRPCKPLELENGRVDLTDLRFGATANFSCNEGHRLIGATSAQCVLVENGVDWDKEVPLCQAISCLPPPDITDGSHNGQSGEEFSFGSAVTYKCDPGFSLIGEASIHCTTKDQVNGEWSGPAPECKGSGTDKLGIGLGIGAVVIICAGMVGASILWQKKKSSFGVKPNLDSRKHHITTEHDFQMSETKSNLILKDNTSLGTGETAYLEAGNGTGLGKATSDTAVPRIC
ncbi:complement receptor type 1 [Chelonia mydas]|uniref:complement receptor type 1 n=1 Tax=Chelonia mydas TaxID=8469 RepID=UPI001CA95052|nr:complement receptor type 1 [Chelonia mydas]